LILFSHRMIPTFLASDFGRSYANIFIVLSLLWGWNIEGDRPERAEVVGAAIALVGSCIMVDCP
jgi:small multidrug resistance family-3 protein